MDNGRFNFLGALARVIMIAGASGRHRVRGQDCVHLNDQFSFISMNSFPPEHADTGRTG